MILGSVLFVIILWLALAEHWILAGLVLLLALPYWWMGSDA